LIIDDEKWVVRSLQFTIEGQVWFTVDGEICDGTAGVDIIRRQKPDLVFLDVNLPGRSGLDILSECWHRGDDTLFIIISGHAEFAYAQKAVFYDAVGYALKPFSRSEMLELLEKAYRILETRSSMGILRSKHPGSQVEIAPQVNNRVVNHMLEYIHQHFREELRISDLSVFCEINPNYVSQLFKKEMNESFSAYLRRLRVRAATEMLRDSGEPIAAIAKAVGFNDYFYFAKVYKAVMNMTPSAYREQNARSFQAREGET
jgi:two-component system response regulator YesN